MFGLGIIIYITTNWGYEWNEMNSYLVAIGLPVILGGFILKELWNFQYSNRKILRIIATALLKTYSNERV